MENKIKIKLLAIVTLNEVKTYKMKNGQDGTIYSWQVKAEKNGKQAVITLKTFSKKIFDTINEKIGQEIEVESQDFYGKKEYVLKTDPIKKPFQAGYRQMQKTDWNTFETIVRKCWALSNEFKREDNSLIFEKILGCASVLIDPEKMKEVPDSYIKQVDNGGF